MINKKVSEHILLSAEISENDYKRQRVNPDVGDEFYIHLIDIKIFLANFINMRLGFLLDYGCGGSPYKTLFDAERYMRADYIDGEGLDFIISNEGKIEIADSSFDTVLSTQVLEHVHSPKAYLDEAFRVLRPGGRLILTTHGIWQDHPCPYDFRRWTRDGLLRELEMSGFRVNRLARITTGPRAVVFLFARYLNQIFESKKTSIGFALWLLKHSNFSNAGVRHRWMDTLYSNNKVIYDEGGGHELYLALGAECVKP
jgi:SAM-dependent methyltransferase